MVSKILKQSTLIFCQFSFTNENLLKKKFGFFLSFSLNLGCVNQSSDFPASQKMFILNFSFPSNGKRIFTHLEFDDFVKYDISLANCVEDEELEMI